MAEALEKILKEKSKSEPEAFPNSSKGYYKRYASFSDYLNNEVHPFVNQAAMVLDIEKGLGFLTDHGPGHIQTVMRRAWDLLGHSSNVLSGYEVYMLLTAIHIHDAGHIRTGRKGHEKASRPLLNAQLGADSVENAFIYSIAEAHGGEVVPGDRDKLARLVPRPFASKKFNMPFLAALLRFADELADDYTRAARYVMGEGGIPHPSEVFHAYAFALKSVDVNLEAKEVQLSFYLSPDDATREFGKLESKVYLLDEILDRTFKMYHECLYCMRYFPAELQINAISVQIEFMGDSEVHQPINYRLKESGYPKLHAQHPSELCGKDLMIDGRVIDGITLKERIEKKIQEHV
ncbi:hypothetical protein Q5H93_21600 [Hymenobacter sp. ASUV-10]|uniref:HD-CE domain-containing protein n=1 Tax=Hymenobacter aranciens TaxID=3063996 RepID=A0ABT9BGF9_9BACT|nr:hypothetical protein [Hymenobacter sp. ASUV-10]MDO7877355.1 hypothetical protein [Hymenobacter sp. ASUV-10]